MPKTQSRLLPIVVPFTLSAISLAGCSGSGGVTPSSSVPQQGPAANAGSTTTRRTGQDDGTQGQQSATYDGCSIFAPGDTYNLDVTNASIDPNSASYIHGAVAAGNTSGFWASTGTEYINIANANTPHLNVRPDVRWYQFPAPYPWQSSFRIEPYGDAHAIVLDTSSCRLYESYRTVYAGGGLSAYSGANWDLTQPFQPLAHGSSAMASGLSIFAGMVKWEEVQAGAINHALNYESPAHTVGDGIYVRPASNAETYAFYGSGPALPYGARLRLKASFDISNFPPQAKIVAQAMKTYGIYLADTGGYGNGLYFANALDGSNPWDDRDLNALSNINISDFDVLTLPDIQRRY